MKTIIFDLDGTLINTAIGLNRCMNIALEKNGLPKISEKQTEEYVGNGIFNYAVRAVFQTFGLPPLDENAKNLCNAVYSDFNAEYAKHGLEGCVLYDGIAETLSALKTKNVRLALLSNKAQFATDLFYKTFLEKYEFAAVVGQREGLALKPAPDGLLAILNSLNADKADALMVGDGETDYLTAKNAGIKCLSVLWGYRDKTRLQAAGATLFANNPKDILNYI